MDSIVKMGTCEKIQESIEAELSISRTDAKKVFDYLAATYRENTSEFGCVLPLGRELVFGDGQYYINLSKSVVMTIAFLLDITLTKGIISGICGMLGIPAQVFHNMNQRRGEVCLLREYLRSNNIVIAEEFQYLIGKECINNDLECIYRNTEGKCCIQESDINEIFGRFREIKIIS